MKTTVRINTLLVGSLLLFFIFNSVSAQYYMYIKKNDGTRYSLPVTEVEWVRVFACGSQTITYEGKIYNTVRIGDRCWMKENLNIGTMINSSVEQSDNGVNNIKEKYCYDNIPSNCDTYGGLYMWEEAMVYLTVEGSRGICPPDWHIPTLAELEVLKNIVNDDGNALKAVGQGSGGGAGTNTSGFSALLAGTVTNLGHGKIWDGLGSFTYLWSSSPFNEWQTYMMGLYGINSEISNSDMHPGYSTSVRCIMDWSAAL